MKNISYRMATAADIPAMIDLRVEFAYCFFDVLPEDGVLSLRASLMEHFTEAYETGSYHCCLAESDGKIAGIGGMTLRNHPGNLKNIEGRTGYIMNMYTRNGYRNMGIGSRILDMLVQAGRSVGVYNFELHATKLGAPVYEKYGFKEHNEPTYRLHISHE